MHRRPPGPAPAGFLVAGSAMVADQSSLPQITNQQAATASQPAPPPSSGASQAPTRPTGPTGPRIPRQYYTMLANRFYHALTKDWVPAELTPEIITENLHATQRRIQRIRVLETEQDALLPAIDARIEQSLFVARMDYRVRFARTFRINDLPTEILNNIFRLICWSAPDPRTSTRSRLYLTWVCRQWRAVMLRDHTIWNAIWFSDEPKFERSLTWFERAGNSAVDLRVNDTKEKPWSLADCRALIDKLFTKISTIRVLVVVLQDWDPILYFLQSLCRIKTEKIPVILERVEVHRTGLTLVQSGVSFHPSVYRRPVQLFGGADVPSLKHLTVNAIHVDWAAFQLRDLRTLDVRRLQSDRVPSITDFRALLANSPNLHKLVLDSAGPRWPPRAPLLEPIALPALASLALGGVSPAYAAYIAAQFTCPNVLDLTIMNAIREDYSPMYQALTERMPRLRVLTVYGAELAVDTPATRAAVLKFFEAVPELAFLRINSVSPDMLDLLLCDTETMQPFVPSTERKVHPVCPALNVIEYHSMDTEHIIKWIHGRRHMGLPLKKLYIGEETVRTVPEETRARLIASLGGLGVAQVLNPILRPREELQLLAGVL